MQGHLRVQVQAVEVLVEADLVVLYHSPKLKHKLVVAELEDLVVLVPNHSLRPWLEVLVVDLVDLVAAVLYLWHNLRPGAIAEDGENKFV